MDSKKRFSNRVAYYSQYRPTYPPALLQHLEGAVKLSRHAVVADIGAGTGLSTKLFLDAGYAAYGVEPNLEMREASARFLAAYPAYTPIDGSAEATTLAAESVDLVTAGQAFHWFEPAGFHREVKRILRPGGAAALFWNDRPAAATPFLVAYEQLLKAYASQYAKVVHRQSKAEKLQTFFGAAGYQTATFPNILTYDREALIGRALSSSYSPLAGQPNHPYLIQGLHDIFERHAENDRVTMPYETIVFWGPVRSS